eukprot:97040-Hanusia_phi.AAC.1
MSDQADDEERARARARARRIREKPGSKLQQASISMQMSSDQLEEETSGSFQFQEIDFKPQVLKDPKKK